MRISTRFTLLVTIAGSLLFGASAWIQFQTEQSDLRAAIRREMELVGKSVQNAVEHALRDQQAADISATLADLDDVDPGLDIYVFDAQGELRGASPGAKPIEEVTPPSRGEVMFEPAGGFERALFTAPLSSNSTRQGVMVVVNPLDAARRDLFRTGVTISGTWLSFLVISALGAFIVGELYIGRPVKRLMRAMRELRRARSASYLPGPPARRRADELEVLESEYEHLHRALLAARERLEAAEAERHELHAALQRADKLVTVGQLAAGLAHEIGSPLQVIHGRLHALLTHLDDRARTQRDVRIALQHTERITRLVERLLGATRNRAKAAEACKPSDAVRAVVDLLERQIERREVEFVLDISADLPDELVDPDPIQQIVLNLLTNALEATQPRDRVTARLHPGERAADGSVRSLRVEVEDTGCGMEAEQVEQAFDPFFTTRADRGGTGLGLAVVRTMTEAGGGTVQLESTPGQGTCVTVDLPLAHKETVHAA